MSPPPLKPIERGDPLGLPCPRCGGVLRPGDLAIPGARTLARAECPACGAAGFADLADRYALAGPLWLEPGGGAVAGETLFDFWRVLAGRLVTETVPEGTPRPEIRLMRRPARPLLLNCLDPFYGHMLLALFQAGHYLRNFPDRDLVVVLPATLAWLLPEGVAGAVLVDWQPRSRYAWDAGLAAAIAEAFPDAAIAPTLPVPQAGSRDIAAHTGVTPYDRDRWRRGSPRVLYCWREDRLWGGSRAEQADRVVALAEALRAQDPDLRFEVAGLAAEPAALPDWIGVHLVAAPSEAQERALAALYADCEVVVGIHGSNMILPSALSGATIELVPRGRWRNAWTASRFRPADGAAAAVFFHRFLAVETAPEHVADLVVATHAFAPSFGLVGLSERAEPGRADPADIGRRAAALMRSAV